MPPRAWVTKDNRDLTSTPKLWTSSYRKTLDSIELPLPQVESSQNYSEDCLSLAPDESPALSSNLA